MENVPVLGTSLEKIFTFPQFYLCLMIEIQIEVNCKMVLKFPVCKWCGEDI